ncbi:hypothetical protein JQ628_22055 [Bradyrhizobium lablabi]|uniref:hypothetical protein n=1 Tax=Bradyrhizobium lablabi TaxID=722472 RepID=UPI001BACA5A3|nr:hypothetical protein [Bradyrhizobium lablabi]MBR1124227.1 hypothetical protein [Bradyrhizobium lablabi]
MRIPEENCNMVLLAAVTAISLAVAGIASVVEPEQPLRQAEASKPVAPAEQTPVRLIGTPFVPNTNPRER